MKRILCKLCSCATISDHQECARCGSGIYDANFVQLGVLSALRSRAARIRPFIRCPQCKRLMINRGLVVCSDKCFENWIPF